jgi:hypothetical protein
MIGFFMILPVSALFLASTLVTTTLTISMGAFIGSLIAYSTTLLAVWIFILS